MKGLLKKIFKQLIKLFVFFLHPFVIKLVSFVSTTINTEFIIKQVKQCGKDPRIQFPIASYGLRYISFGDSLSIGLRLRIEAYDRHLNNLYNPEIIIGNNVSIGDDCHIACVNKIVIGNNVLIASKVFITDHFHGETTSESILEAPNFRQVISKGTVIIEDNVWIGENVSIMPNIQVGENTIIGANSVVTKNIPKNTVVAGNPAKVLKKL